MSRPEKLALPSGRLANLRKHSDPLRPWEAFRQGSTYFVRRPRRGNAGEWELFGHAGPSTPLFLDRDDAVALVDALNARPPRERSPRPE